MLRHAAMALHPPPRHTSLIDQRQTGCTHMQMTRIFDKYGSLKCSLCHNPPSIGWLYRCTQDSGGFLPESDFQNEKELKSKQGYNESMLSLSPSILDSINKGLYSEDQVRMLVQQKEQVWDTILTQEARPPTATSTSAQSTRSSSLLPESSTFTTTSSISLDDEIRAAYDWSELQRVWLSEPSVAQQKFGRSALDLSRVDMLEPDISLPMPPCKFKICPACRPTYRDRAYQSIDAVLTKPVVPTEWELSNRPVSDASLLSRICLPKLRRVNHHLPSGILTTANNTNGTSVLDTAPGHEQGDEQGHYKHSVRCRTGFRETVRKALNMAQAEDPTSLSLEVNRDDSSENSSNDSSKTVSRLKLFMRRKPLKRLSLPQYRTSAVNSASLQDSLMLMLAANTPLPQGPPTPLWSTNDATHFNQSDGGVGVYSHRSSFPAQTPRVHV